MIHCRPFLNCDPPAIAGIWCSQPPNRGLLQPMTAALLDDQVLSKPYFDRRGLLVALDGDTPVGFAHAGFAAAVDGSSLDQRKGTIWPIDDSAGRAHRRSGWQVGRGVRALLATVPGARQIYAGATNELAPFYLGLYGGSKLPGVLASDIVQNTCFQEAGYVAAAECAVLECQLAGFRPVADRQILRLRRQRPVVPCATAAPLSWWDACRWSNDDVIQFEVAGSATDDVARATFWDVEPLASGWGWHAMGLWDLLLPAGQERALLTVYLLNESMRCLQTRGVSLVEVQTPTGDLEILEACERLGYREADRGVLFSKSD